MPVADRPRLEILKMVSDWEVPVRPSCSNCSNARVYGRPEWPLIRCAAGFDGGKRVELWRLIRSYRPVGLRAADKCPGFDSMDDEHEVVP